MGGHEFEPSRLRNFHFPHFVVYEFPNSVRFSTCGYGEILSVSPHAGMRQATLRKIDSFINFNPKTRNLLKGFLIALNFSL